MKRFRFGFIALCFAATVFQVNHVLATSFDKQIVCNDFQLVKAEFSNRWQAFQLNRPFKLFEMGKSESFLKEEFEVIEKTRKNMWTSLDYEVADNLVRADLIRAPGCIPFVYNSTVPYYNASTIYLRNRFFIACEGPRSKDIPKFFKLLISHNVTRIVRLTSAYEGWNKKCHPYWEDLSITDTEEKTYLSLPDQENSYFVRTFHMDQWRDHHGVDPQELLNLVLQLKKELEETNGLAVIHCSAGVGRTGTFLAAFAIVDAIEKKEPFSIEEIVYRLSLRQKRESPPDLLVG